MKSIILIFGLSLFVSCKNTSTQNKVPLKKNQTNLSIQEMFKTSYDIVDLQTYADTTKFISRFSTTKKYDNIIFIELTEAADDIILCVKQPVLEFNKLKSFDSNHRLPFNQLCYWFTNADAKNIKDKFLAYNTFDQEKDIKCSGCLDAEAWKIEIYDHGRYSSITRDYVKDKDRTFIDFLFKMVQLNTENGYRIK